MISYADDYNGIIAGQQKTPSERIATIYSRLKYLSYTMFYCPSIQVIQAHAYNDWFSGTGNAVYDGSYLNAARKSRWGNFFSDSKGQYYDTRKMKAHSEIHLISDTARIISSSYPGEGAYAYAGSFYSEDSYGIVLIHNNNSVNLGFADGHAIKQRKEELLELGLTKVISRNFTKIE